MKLIFNKFVSPVLKTMSAMIFAFIASNAYAGYYFDSYTVREGCGACYRERVVTCPTRHHVKKHRYYKKRVYYKKPVVYKRKSSYHVSVHRVGYYDSCYCRYSCAPCYYRYECAPCRYECNRCYKYNSCYKYNCNISLDRSTADDVYPEYD